ncbi:uncharacterized protein BNAC06G22260D [Brassica napus]|nr:uncharacterized protein BNAC06G22260D [Brassica napus]
MILYYIINAPTYELYLSPFIYTIAKPTRSFILKDHIFMKVFHKFRKIFMRLIDLTIPSSSRRKKNGCEGERSEPPKISCSSSYYSSHVPFSEAIADCIEFFNKSSTMSCDAGQELVMSVDVRDCFYV